MNKLNVYCVTTRPPADEPKDDDDDNSSPTYEEVHDDGDSGYGNSKD